ncbi:site-specific integrase [Acetobacterium sp. KB-1]
MRKVKDPELFCLIKKFLGSYLLSIRQRSDNTADSYRYALNLYLAYVQEKHNKALSEVLCCDFS